MVNSMKCLKVNHAFLHYTLLLVLGLSCSEDKGSVDEMVYEDETFKLLESVVDIVVIDGVFLEKYEANEATSRVFDARNTEFITGIPMWGSIDINSDSSITGMVWAGGYVHSNKPWNSSWDDHKATSEDNLPGRNSTAIENRSSATIITGMYARNVYDAFRTTNAKNWRVQHSWSSYVRDDAVENDDYSTGTIYDCLFDGTYTGISSEPDNASLDAGDNVVYLNKVLLRIQAMPYPYDWTNRAGVINENNEVYNGIGIPYGHGSFFKTHDKIEGNIHWSIKNSVLVAVNDVDHKKFDFPDAELLNECSDNTIVWLGTGDYPGYLPTTKYPKAFTIMIGEEGRQFWIQKVTDWHVRHPFVGENHKPSNPGTIVFPEKF